MNSSNALSTLKATLYQHIAITHVVAFDKNRCIGKDNQLAWHIPEDLTHFKKITKGGVVLMGRKTFVSIGKALPQRTNWVISRDANFRAQGIKISLNLSDALYQAHNDVLCSDKPTALFIIGGAEIFRQTLAITDTLEITQIDLAVAGDRFYPHFDKEKDFSLTKQHTLISAKHIRLAFQTYQRRQQYDR